MSRKHLTSFYQLKEVLANDWKAAERHCVGKGNNVIVINLRNWTKHKIKRTIGKKKKKNSKKRENKEKPYR